MIVFNSNKDIQEFMQRTNLKYPSLDEMLFDDSYYLTHWTFSKNSLVSTTKYSKLETESFEMPFSSLKSIDFSGFSKGYNQDVDKEGSVFSSQLHKNRHIELYYIQKGELILEVSGKSLTLETGDILMLDCHTLHADQFKFEDASVFILGIKLNTFNDYAMKLIKDQKFDTFIKNSMNNKYLGSEYWLFKNSNAMNHDILGIISSIVLELENKDLANVDVLRILVSRIVRTMATSNSLSIVHSDPDVVRNVVFDAIVSIIDAKYASVSLDELSKELMYSKDYFNRIIKEFTGLTYTQYLQDVRVKKSKELLLETKLSVQEVANAIGYSNVKHYYDIFKKINNMTPQEYRNLMLDKP